ncbi:MAG TPA: UDP-N-acetylmuramoyl-L-alanine--D-glutamate ligase [Gaiellaceae bacterium]|jgi:UDP-N-acetylmuramoylalanine--D-glutamate ligase|nr:UDP-N-acetylmuramoyl-L-alanine--D-glutamate ligase [Gaiellaceae bacterium]
MTYLVLGLARSGRAAALALARRGERVVAVDRSPHADPGRLAEAGVELRLGTEELTLLEGVDVLIKSPGVPSEAPLVAAARERGIPVWSEVELGGRLLSTPILGVTGTNGKTTTTALLGEMLGAPVAGNIGRALTELEEGGRWIVCELSSFQLEDVHDFRPPIAVLLNLEPDHLDRHGTLEAYRDAKLRIFENQRPDDVAVVPSGFGELPGQARRVEFSGDDPLPDEPRIPGAHNRENAAAAVAAAREAGASEERIARALREFPGVPHRLEDVAEIGGVRFVNDSKATNAAAARRAIASFGAPLHVILGGLGKNESYAELAADLRARGARAYLIGAAADELAAAIPEHERSGDLATAVRSAAAAARPGEIVLLSPACASYDQFRDFEERGDEFRRLVEELA